MSTDTEESEHVEAESTVNDSFGTTIPAEVREALNDALEPGDKVRWVVEDGKASIEIVQERYGVATEAGTFDGPAWEDSEAVVEESYGEE